MRGKHCITLRGCLSADEITRGGDNVPLTYLWTTRRCRARRELRLVRSLSAIVVSATPTSRNNPHVVHLSLSCLIRIQRARWPGLLVKLDRVRFQQQPFGVCIFRRPGYIFTVIKSWGTIDFCQLETSWHLVCA